MYAGGSHENPEIARDAAMALAHPTESDRAPHALRRLANLPISLLGLALFRAWVPTILGQSSNTDAMGLLHDGVLAALLLCGALLAARIAPLSRHRWPLYACAAASLGTWLAFLARANGFDAPAASVLMATLCAVASALFILQWCEVYARLPVDQTALVLGLSFVLGRALAFLMAGMAPVQTALCLLALPLLCMLALARARTVAPAEATSPAAAKGNLPWGIMALIGLYYLVSGACLQGAGHLADALSGIMTATAGAALVGAVLFFGGSLDLSRVCKSPVAMLCCVLLLIPFAGSAANPLAAGCTALSAAVFELVVFLMMCDLCRRRNLPAVFVFGVEESLTVLRPLGAFLAGAATQAHLPTALVEAAAVGILAVATLVLFNRADLQKRWGIAVLDRGGLSEGRDAKERLAASCERLCDEAGLTPREREALGYLAQGLTVAELAQAMGVAKGTAKAHCEHVYAKLGIHGREELERMLGGAGEE